MLLTDLVTGALVQILADGAVVGGGAALDTATIFKINPPIDPSKKYSSVQALCELKSPLDGSVTPVKDPPPPTIRSPLCHGGKYVTVCDTAALSTVKVSMDGSQIAQGAGNGGCVTLGLGDATVFLTGKKVSAVQIVAGKTSPPSASVIVTASGAPSYNPGPWNSSAHQSHNNCYNYSTDIMTDTFAQPGQAHGVFPPEPPTCAGTGSGAVADGLVAARGEALRRLLAPRGARHLPRDRGLRDGLPLVPAGRQRALVEQARACPRDRQGRLRQPDHEPGDRRPEVRSALTTASTTRSSAATTASTRTWW